jgi:ribosomal protein S18 acetylase RimI-like enzyme
VVEYRSFRNDDPPALVGLWNDSVSSRGAVQLAGTTEFEHYVLAKPYFDSAGLLVAVEDGRPVGFAHAGLGPNESQTALGTQIGVLCAVVVHPIYRRRGIGSELVRRSEDYLRRRGAQTLQAGPRQPAGPFYFGLYGGSDLPGFLLSDTAAEPFFHKNAYRDGEPTLVMHRRLDQPLKIIDSRFPALRRQYDVELRACARAYSWWLECVYGPVELFEASLIDRTSGQAAARADLWEMNAYRFRWREVPAGIQHVEVRPELRRVGLGRFLLSQLLAHLKEQYYTLVEIQGLESNNFATRVLRSIGFEQVDLGRTYLK